MLPTTKPGGATRPVRILLTVTMLLFAASAAAQTQAPQNTPIQQPQAPQLSAPNLGRSRLTQAQVENLAATINQLTSAGEAARAFWGIEIVSAADGHVIYEQNPDRLFTPASNAKLFTTISALALLGPEYTEKTTVESAAALSSDGKLKGDLVLVGRGDPNLSGRAVPYVYKFQPLPPLHWLEELADQVAQKGVRRIEGDIVGDDTAFAWERYGEGWSQDDLMWDYGAPVSALTVNDNVQTLTILPGGKPGDKAVLKFEPDVPFYEIDNRITTTAAGSGPRNISMDRQPGSRTLVLWGTVPQDDTTPGEDIAIEEPAEFAAIAFKKMLEERGIKITGTAKAQHQLMADVVPKAATAEPSAATAAIAPESAPHPPPMNVFAEHDSAPLADDVGVTLKVSQNLHAEITLRLIGKEKGLAPTVAESLKVEKQVFDQAGILPEEYAFYDGSGLSRQDLVSPRAVVKLLRYADAQPWSPVLRQSLPVAGADGTLDDRMKNTAAQGRVMAKTGTLDHVSSISGFATTLGGERVVFSILVNNHKLRSRGSTAIMDQILESLVGMDVR